MEKYLKYLKYVFRHKWFVFQECRKFKKLFWQGVVHDLSKFLPDELIPYVNYFYGGDTRKDRFYSPSQGTESFNYAWLKHQHRNPHHWQHWLGVGIDVITGNWYNANDEGDYCQCLKIRNSKRKTLNSVPIVDSKNHAKNSCTEDKSGDGAKFTTPTMPENIKKNTLNTFGNGNAIEMLETPNIIDRDKGTYWFAIASKFLNIMAGTLQNVLVVAKKPMSFLPLTTLTEEGKNGERNLRKEWEDLELTGGRSKMDFLRSSEFFVTTATPPMDTMGTVLMRKTNLLAEDDGGLFCLSCGKKVPKKSLIPLEMPTRYVFEMVCDWRGAGKAQGFSDTLAWYQKNKDKMILHPETRKLVEATLEFME